MLKEYIKQVRGVSYKPEDVLKKYDENAIPIIRANNIQDNKLNLDGLIYVNKSKVKKDQLLQEGDIVICTSSGSKDLVGKAAICLGVKNLSFGAFCKVVRTNKLNKKYLAHFFNSDIYRNSISKSAKGANINNIRNEDIDNLEITIPSISEQQRIANELDKVSELIDKRQTQLQRLDLLIKSKFVEMFGDPINNNISSNKIKLGDIAILKAGKNVTSANIHNKNEQYPYPCYGGNGIRGYVSNYSHDGCFCLIGRQGALCGNVQLAEGKFYATEHAVVVNLQKSVNEKWLYYMLTYLNLNRYQTGAAQPGLNIEILNNVEFSNFKIEIQKQFADFVDKVEQSKTKIKASLDKLITLKKALMQKYFG